MVFLSQPVLVFLNRRFIRWFYALLVLSLVVASGYSLQNLSLQKQLSSETEITAAQNGLLEQQVLGKYRAVSAKIKEAEQLGANVTGEKEKLARTYSLIFSTQQYRLAGNLLSAQLSALDSIIQEQMTANSASEAEKQKGTLSGVVKEGTNNVSGVKISVQQSGNELISTTSAADGRYSLRYLAGSYTVVASKSGYTTSSKKSVSISAGQTTTYDISLTKAPPAAPKDSGSSSSDQTNGESSYELKTVSVGGTNYSVHLSTFNLASGQFRVITDTANDDDCTDNCPTKSLSSYVGSHGGFAGMNGTYFCPVDYSACAGKTGSFYWKVWNSRLSKMINGGTNSFLYEPFLTVNGNTAKYYNSWSDFSGSLTAGISSSPALISGGNNVLDHGKLDDKQRNTKSNRGAVGLKGQVLYLAIAKSATVIDLAGIMDALDVDYAMNLDGGGSSAMMFNNSYKIGPGRAIPNAIIVAKR